MSKAKANRLFDYYVTFSFIILVSSIVKGINVLYKYGVYLYVLFGVVFFGYCLLQHQFAFQKTDLLVGIFSLAFLITIFLNREKAFARQVFVFLCCLTYFFLFCFSRSRSECENVALFRVLLKFIVVLSFVFAITSYVLVFIDKSQHTTFAYNIHRGKHFQLIGVYTSLSNLALFSGLSSICSLFCFFLNEDRKVPTIAWRCCCALNFFLQLITMTLAYTTASLVSCVFCLILFCGVYSRHKYVVYNDRSAVHYIVLFFLIFLSVCLAGLISSRIVVSLDLSTYMETKSSGTIELEVNVDNTGELEGNIDNTGQIAVAVEPDNAISGILSSNGRLPIWRAAVKAWMEKPIFGYGYGNADIFVDEENALGERVIKEYQNVHSGYLDVLVSCGLAGFIPIMIFGAICFVNITYNLFVKKLILFDVFWITIATYCCINALVNKLFILDRGVYPFFLCLCLGSLSANSCGRIQQKVT